MPRLAHVSTLSSKVPLEPAHDIIEQTDLALRYTACLVTGKAVSKKGWTQSLSVTEACTR